MKQSWKKRKQEMKVEKLQRMTNSKKEETDNKKSQWNKSHRCHIEDAGMKTGKKVETWKRDKLREIKGKLNDKRGKREMTLQVQTWRKWQTHTS